MNVSVIGAHPDDAEGYCGGTAAKMAAAGHAVKFLSLTNGDAGHHEMGGATLVRRRRGELEESARRLGIAAGEALDNHDGELMPTLELRRDVLKHIREWKADLVIAHRPDDYHPDHRYAALTVQDAGYMTMVPNVCPSTPPLRRNPVFVYMEQEFSKPLPKPPDVAVSIDGVWEKKVSALDAHESQFYEWLPWIEGEPESVPGDAAERTRWLGAKWSWRISPAMREALVRRYGEAEGGAVRHAEAFTLCEYGRQPAPGELDRIFPR
jgi:LmbE family N-acetylglucosaminyl deacetylase